VKLALVLATRSSLPPRGRSLGTPETIGYSAAQAVQARVPSSISALGSGIRLRLEKRRGWPQQGEASRGRRAIFMLLPPSQGVLDRAQAQPHAIEEDHSHGRHQDIGAHVHEKGVSEAWGGAAPKLTTMDLTMASKGPMPPGAAGTAEPAPAQESTSMALR